MAAMKKFNLEPHMLILGHCGVRRYPSVNHMPLSYKMAPSSNHQ